MMSDIISTALFCNDPYALLLGSAMSSESVYHEPMPSMCAQHYGDGTYLQNQPCVETCHSSQDFPDVHHRFWSHLVTETKVDFSTFLTLTKSEMVNFYFGTITEDQTSNSETFDSATDNSVDEKTSDADSSNGVVRRYLPYRYAAIIASAIYVSGIDCLSIDDIVRYIWTTFPDIHLSKHILLKNITRACSKNKMLFTVNDVPPRKYSVDSSFVSKKIFARADKQCDVTLEEYLNLPGMISHLSKGLRLNGNPARSNNKAKNVNSLKRKSSAQIERKSKRPRLELPDQPRASYDDDGHNYCSGIVRVF